MASFFATKPLSQLLSEGGDEGEHGLKRSLGKWALCAIGVGAIIGAGIFSALAPAAAAGELVANATIPASSPGPDGSAAAKGFPVLNWERYEFVRLLGRGGMGAVYMARDRRLGRIVALKFLRTEDPLMVQRFQQEARAQASIDHPLICKVFEVGEVEGKAYIAMQYVSGQSLEQAGRGAVDRFMHRLDAQALVGQARALAEDRGFGWTHGQAEATKGVLTTSSRVLGIQGYAGTAKTTTVLATVAEAAAGHGVDPEARPVGHARVDGGDVAGAERQLVCRLALKIKEGNVRPQLRRRLRERRQLRRRCPLLRLQILRPHLLRPPRLRMMMTGEGEAFRRCYHCCRCHRWPAFGRGWKTKLRRNMCSAVCAGGWLAPTA